MISRRRFVGASGLVLIGLQAGWLAGCDRKSDLGLEQPLDGGDFEDALRDLAGSFSGIAYVGPECLSEQDPKNLLRELYARLRETRAPVLGAALEQAVATDFSENRIRDVAGWQLSDTECALAALAALIQGLRNPVLADGGDMIEREFVKVENWGPRGTYQYRPFHPQPDGGGGLWVRIESDAPGSTRLAINGEILETRVGTSVITAIIGPEEINALIDEPGSHTVDLVDPARGLVQTLGDFIVHPAAEPAKLEDGTFSRVFCEIEAWGPQTGSQGVSFNQQPDGSAGLWVRTGCAPSSAVLTLAGRELPTTVTSEMVTARVEFYAELDAGEHPLWLVDPDSGERLRVGDLQLL